MPYPDDFTWDRFERHHGPTKRARGYDARISDPLVHATHLRDAAKAFLEAIKHIQDIQPSPIDGYDVSDIREIVGEVAAIDIGAYHTRLRGMFG